MQEKKTTKNIRKQITLRIPYYLYEMAKKEAELSGITVTEELRNRLISDYQSMNAK